MTTNLLPSYQNLIDPDFTLWDSFPMVIIPLRVVSPRWQLPLGSHNKDRSVLIIAAFGLHRLKLEESAPDLCTRDL
jgi:hypothetical protein